MWLASGNKRRRLNPKNTKPEEASSSCKVASIVKDSEHILEIIGCNVCPYLPINSIVNSLGLVSKSMNSFTQQNPFINKMDIFKPYDTIPIIKTNIGVTYNNAKNLKYLKRFNFQNVKSLKIETSRQPQTFLYGRQPWFNSEVAHEMITSFAQIHKLEVLLIDVHSINQAFIGSICMLIRKNIKSLHTIKLLCTTRNCVMVHHQNESDEQVLVNEEVQKTQNEIDKWCAKIILSFTINRDSDSNNILKNIFCSFIGQKTANALCCLQRKCNYHKLSVDVIDCDLLVDIKANDSDDNMTELYANQYISNWNGLALLSLFKSVKCLGLTAGGLFPFTSTPIRTETFRICITEPIINETMMRMYEVFQTIPGKIRRLEVWNSVNHYDDTQQIRKWWKWIPFPLSKACRELLLRDMDISDGIDMFNHKTFKNIRLLIIRSDDDANAVVLDRIRRLLPKVNIELQPNETSDQSRI